MWPFSRRKAPEIETRAAFPSVTAEYLSSRRSGLLSDSTVPLSATIATCAQIWSRAMAMVDFEPGEPAALSADVLAAIGLDLCLKGESCWHIRLERGDVRLVRAAWWDELGNGRYHLHIPHPASTESVRALEGEVLRLNINAPAEQPWRGRSPFALCGVSPALMAEIENAISGSMEWIGRGLIAFPPEVPEEQQAAAIAGLKGGSRLAALKSWADFATSTGQSRGSEFKRIELGPDLESADLNPAVDALHNRLLAAAGIPPTLFTANGNAGAMREGHRLFTLLTIIPVAKSLLPELSKIGVTSVSSRSISRQIPPEGRARFPASWVPGWTSTRHFRSWGGMMVNHVQEAFRRAAARGGPLWDSYDLFSRPRIVTAWAEDVRLRWQLRAPGARVKWSDLDIPGETLFEDGNDTKGKVIGQLRGLGLVQIYAPSFDGEKPDYLRNSAGEWLWVRNLIGFDLIGTGIRMEVRKLHGTKSPEIATDAP